MHKDKAVTIFNPDYTLENIMRPEKPLKQAIISFSSMTTEKVKSQVPATVYNDAKTHLVAQQGTIRP